MPEQFSAKKDRRGQKTRRSHSVRVFSARKYRGGGGQKTRLESELLSAKKKAQRESKSKRIVSHTCFQACIETPDLDDVALANYQIQGWTLLSNQPGKSPGTCRCSSSCCFLARSHIHVFEIVTTAPIWGLVHCLTVLHHSYYTSFPMVLSEQALKWDRVRLFAKSNQI